MRNSTWKRYVWTVAILLLGSVFLAETCAAQAGERALVHVVYFTSAECPHCRAVFNEVLTLLQKEYDDQLQIKVVDISDPSAPGSVNATHYEMLVRAEAMFDVPPEERGLPMVIVGGEALVGEDVIRERLPCLIADCLVQEGAPWPDIPGLANVAGEPTMIGPGIGLDPGGEEIQPCEPEAAICAAPAPVWMAYFYEVGCQECSRAEYDIRYVESVYPQVMVEEYNVQGDAALAEWLGARLGAPEEKRLATPALFVGDDYLIGPEITSEAVTALVAKYTTGGAERVWDDFHPAEAERSIVERFESFGALTVAFAGLVDGLNPCAFATLCFFVSYLALSGRQEREVLTVGAAFTLGVFLAYLAVGLGFYQALDLLGDLLTTLGRWVYGLTGLFCAALAVLSFLDFLKARRSGIGDMALNLPHALRMRINAVIRQGRHSRALVAGSFFTGVVVSFLELACTGQVYLPTIVFVVSRPETQVRGLLFLILYNLLFIVPLVAVFILAYCGTTSKQLTRFLERRGATIKLGMALLFAALAAWLLVTAMSA
jgi:cytochrome c biogenesis protein CcdA/thiol-disulfide isomerase/thioredoxin